MLTMSLKYNSLVEEHNFNIPKIVKEVNKVIRSNLSFRGRCKCLRNRHVKQSFLFAVFKNKLPQYSRQDTFVLQRKDRSWSFIVNYKCLSLSCGCRIAEISAGDISGLIRRGSGKSRNDTKIWQLLPMCHCLHFQALICDHHSWWNQAFML